MALHRRQDSDTGPIRDQAAMAGPTDERPNHKLSANENPFSPLPSVIDAITHTLPLINLYPETAVSQLASMVAPRFGVAIENLAFGAGSVEVASQLIHAVTDPGDEVIFAWRSFEAYPVLVTVAGAVPIPVPLDGHHQHDLAAMLAAVTDRTRLIFICNPNNPTGSVVDHQGLREFIAAVPERVLVVIDEAYTHFDTVPESARGVELFHEFHHVALLRTFSKAYGLAGLRIGFAVAPQSLVSNLRHAALPFRVTTLAQHAAMASLTAEPELQERVDRIVHERDRVSSALTGPYEPVRSGANFVWLPVGELASSLAAYLDHRGLSVRAFDNEGLRITIGSQEANDRLIDELLTFER